MEPSSQHKKQSTKKILSTRKYDPEKRDNLGYFPKKKGHRVFWRTIVFFFFFVCFQIFVTSLVFLSKYPDTELKKMPYTIGVMRVRTTISTVHTNMKRKRKTKETESSSKCLKTEQNYNFKNGSKNSWAFRVCVCLIMAVALDYLKSGQKNHLINKRGKETFPPHIMCMCFMLLCFLRFFFCVCGETRTAWSTRDLYRQKFK